jgi:sugar-specific transcriptional regulator TrmB
MIIEKKLMLKLKDLGLNSYESKVWVALLSRGISTAGELSDIANVPRSRSYDVLESLEKKGFVIMKLGKPIKYIAIPPKEAIERIKKKIKKTAQEEENLLNELKKSEVLKELTELHANGIDAQDPSDITGSVKGRDSIYNHLVFQIKNAKESIVISTTETGLARKSKSLLRHIKKAKNRGVNVKFFAPLTNTNFLNKLENYAELHDQKAEARFCIIDNNEITLMLTDDTEVHPTNDLAIWMQSPYVANTLLSTVE